MNVCIRIGNRTIGTGHQPFIIAEMSGNHNQSLERALAIVDAAAEAGVDALKLQTYSAESMTLNLNGDDFFISDTSSPWKHKSLYELYEQAYTPWEWHQPIFERCQEHGIIGFSTPFDETAVDFLESLNVPMYKIASFENTDFPLIEKVASTGKPIIISSGMATAAELEETVNIARRFGVKDIIVLKCTSTYPAAPVNTNLLTIPHMKDLLHCETGLSDHTLGIGVAVASVAFGATVIEKHFTLSRTDGGVDSSFSLEPAELKNLVEETTRAWQALGTVHYGVSAEEKPSMQYRRSLYITKDIQAGDIFSKENIRAIRPGYGLPPKYLDVFLGKRCSVDLKKGTPVAWEMLNF